MHRLSIVPITLCCFIAAGSATCQEIAWVENLDEAKKIALEQDKLILLHFYADWCRPCKQLETFVYRSAIVAKEIQDRVVPVRIDTDLNPHLIKQYEISEIPYDIVVSPDGRVIEKRKSPVDVDNYLKLIRSIPAVASTTQTTRGIEEAVRPSSNRSQGSIQTTSFHAPTQNDFEVEAPKHSQPAPSHDSNELAAKLPSTKQQLPVIIRPTNEQANPATSTSGTGPRRVTNQFFTEQPTSQVADANFVPPTPNATSNPFSDSNNAQRMLDAQPDSALPQHGQHVTVLSIPEARRELQVMANSELKAPAKSPPLEPDLPALNGKCPVTLIAAGKWVAGDPRFGCIHRGRLYLFADAEKQKQFQADPDTFSPVLAGYDPVAFHRDGQLIEGLPQHGVFMGIAPKQQVILFHSASSRDEFQANPEKYLGAIKAAIRQADQLNQVETLR
jgi:thiol-disulfide isomerase/thioredoxin